MRYNLFSYENAPQLLLLTVVQVLDGIPNLPPDTGKATVSRQARGLDRMGKAETTRWAAKRLSIQTLLYTK